MKNAGLRTTNHKGRRVKIVLGLAVLCGSILNPLAYAADWILLGDFGRDWRQSWKERVVSRHANSYQIVKESGRNVLRIISHKSASGFWHEYQVRPVSSGRISWRWKINAGLSHISDERSKKGDDYAARVFVVFEPSFFTWRTRSICYVWAGLEPPGSVYANPFSDSVGTIVLETGNEKSKQWVPEERDFVADYKKYFQESPSRVSAVAVMVDTDNTDSEAIAWFGDIKITAK